MQIGAKIITPKHVKIAVKDSDFSDMQKQQKTMPGFLTLLALLTLVGIAFGGWWFSQNRPDLGLEILKNDEEKDIISQTEDSDAPPEEHDSPPSWQKLNQEVTSYE